jgi:hypothetical protein
MFKVTGAVTNATGYSKVAVTHVVSSGTFSNTDGVGVHFSYSGVDGSGNVSTDGVQTLTNKTLTSPKINEDVVMSSTATELNKLDALSRGSIIYGNASAATAVLTKGGAATVLTSDGTDISWSAVASGIEWQSSIVTASTLSAAVNKGYWINTTSNACTITLPGSASVGDQLIFVDYSRNWSTNAVTINQNSLKFQGFTSPNPVYDTIGQTINIVYSGSGAGWIPISDDAVANETPQPIVADFLVIAGGGGGGNDASGGAGAGGYRASFNSETSGGGGSSESAITLTAGQAYTAVVGAGGAGDTASGGTGVNGVNSSLAGADVTTITSIGGGGAGTGLSGVATGANGGSGGGAKGSGDGGSGTTNQGFAGNGNNGSYVNGGGGGAGSAGGASITEQGGIGVASTISGSSVYRGGGGCGYDSPSAIPALAGGAGNGAYPSNTGTAVTANTGAGGAGGGANAGIQAGLVGAAGVVILRLPTDQYTGTTSGSPTISTSGSDTIITFNANGTYTA